MHRTVLFVSALLMVGPITALPHTEDQAHINVTGVWAMTVDTPVGAVTEDVTFSQKEERLEVTMSGPPPEMTSSGEGTVKGDLIEWVQTIHVPQGDFRSTFKGKIDGDKMSGELRRGKSDAVGWSAVRKK